MGGVGARVGQGVLDRLLGLHEDGDDGGLGGGDDLDELLAEAVGVISEACGAGWVGDEAHAKGEHALEALEARGDGVAAGDVVEDDEAVALEASRAIDAFEHGAEERDVGLVAEDQALAREAVDHGVDVVAQAEAKDGEDGGLAGVCLLGQAVCLAQGVAGAGEGALLAIDGDVAGGHAVAGLGEDGVRAGGGFGDGLGGQGGGLGQGAQVAFEESVVGGQGHRQGSAVEEDER